MKKILISRIGIIFGGMSPEHEVSISSADNVVANIDRDRYKVQLIYVTKDGRWLTTKDDISPKDFLSSQYTPLIFSINPSEARKFVDIFFPLIHGINGEDGTIQGFLELLDIPYIGSSVLASAIGMDKSIMKMLFKAWHIPVADFLIIHKEEMHDSKKDEIDDWIINIKKEIGFPCFVKPTNTGSSIGISKVCNDTSLLKAVNTAFKFDNKILIEKGIDAREIEIGVLGHKEIMASCAGEIAVAVKIKDSFYDYKAKYTDGLTEIIIPADIEKEVYQRIRHLAIKIFAKLGCSGMARVDFFIDKNSCEIYVNEINTIPGFTRTSMYPMLWEYEGIKYAELIDQLIACSIEKYRDKKEMQNTF